MSPCSATILAPSRRNTRGLPRREHTSFTLGQVKKAAILAAVEQLDGNVRLAAENLQMSETTLQPKLKEYRVIIKQRRGKERKSSLGAE
jgi:DNA-binding NtrC family response regulator